MLLFNIWHNLLRNLYFLSFIKNKLKKNMYVTFFNSAGTIVPELGSVVTFFFYIYIFYSTTSRNMIQCTHIFKGNNLF